MYQTYVLRGNRRTINTRDDHAPAEEVERALVGDDGRALVIDGAREPVKNEREGDAAALNGHPV
jgi:hypothetical protein